MLRFLAVFVLLFTPAIAAEPLVLVPQMPEYQEGESAWGMVMFPGLRLEITQRVERGPDGQMYVMADLQDSDGTVYGRLIFDPRTWRAQYEVEGVTSRILNTTCSPEFYPLMLGVTYECESTIDENGRVFTTRDQVTFEAIERNELGSVIALCALTKGEDINGQMTGRMCLSPNGKWMQSFIVYEMTIYRKS